MSVNDRKIIAITVGVVLGVLAVLSFFCLLLVVLIKYLRRRKPVLDEVFDKTTDEYLTIVATDITDSNELWESDKNSMRNAVKLHNKLIRKYITENKGYEFHESLGNFMIAFNEAFDAIQFCNTVQQELLHLNWPPAIFKNPKYIEIKNDFDEELLFRGLRVRMGVHIGYPIARKEYSKTVFSGSVVNLVRNIVEEVDGGLTFISKDVYDYIYGEKSEISRHIIDTSYIRSKGLYSLENREIELFLLIPNVLAFRDGRTIQVKNSIQRLVSLSSASSTDSSIMGSLLSLKKSEKSM